MNNNSKLVWTEEYPQLKKSSGIGHFYRVGKWKEGEFHLYIEQMGTGYVYQRTQETPEMCQIAAQIHEDSITSLLAEKDEIIKDALESFSLTQKPSIYSANHWSNRALSLHKKGVA